MGPFEHDKLQKLRIRPLDRNLNPVSGGGVGSGVGNTGAREGQHGSEVTVSFNPREYTIEQSNTFAEIGIPGLEAPILQFVRGNAEKLTFDLLIDVTDRAPEDPDRNAARIANSILLLARVDSDRHAPPVCKFEWGGEVMNGVIESVRRQFLLFDPSGTPIRIQMALGVKRYRTLTEQIGTMNRRSPDRTRTVVVAEGDTLPGIAFRCYGDDALWRYIALHPENALDDAANLVPGMILEVPRIEDPSQVIPPDGDYLR
jgi:nucleoid-associated protein YgaU